MAIGVGVLLIQGWTWKGVYVDALRIKKARLSVEFEELHGQQKHLVNRLTTLRSFTRIDQLAREELQMQYAKQPPRILPVPGFEFNNRNPEVILTQNESFASVE